MKISFDKDYFINLVKNDHKDFIIPISRIHTSKYGVTLQRLTQEEYLNIYKLYGGAVNTDFLQENPKLKQLEIDKIKLELTLAKLKAENLELRVYKTAWKSPLKDLLDRLDK